MNKCIFMGRLTKEPETRYSGNGNAVVNFGVAINRRYKREGKPDADFINCVAFGKTGEVVAKYFGKGSMISLVGELRNEKYTDKNGTDKQITKIYVNEVYFTGEVNKTAQRGEEGTNKEEYTTEEVIDEDELPF